MSVNKFRANVSWLFFEKIIRYTLGVFISIWVARYFGPKEYGIFSYVTAFSSFFFGVSMLGLPQILIREYVKQNDNSEKLLSTGVILILLGSLLTYVIAVFIMYLIRPDDLVSFFLTVLIAGKMFFNFGRAISCYFESIVKSKFNVIANTIGYLGGILVKIYVVLTSSSLFVLGGSLFIEALLTTLVLYIYVRKMGFNIKLGLVEKKVVFKLLRDSSPLILSAAVIAMHLKIDQVMVRDLVGDEEAGYYAVAVRLTELWYFFPVIIQSTFFPMLVKTKQVNESVFYEKVHGLFSFLIIISISIAIVVSISSSTLILLTFGNEYSESIVLLKWLIFALLFVSINVIRNAYLYTQNHVKLHFYIVAVGVLVNIVGNMIMIPSYGALGASIITLTSYCFTAVFANFLFKSTRKVGWVILKSFIFPRFDFFYILLKKSK